MPGFAALPSPHTVWTAPCVAVGLLGGFGVAQATGVRELGGMVLLVAGATAARTWFHRSIPHGVGLSAAYIGAFVASHPLAKILGAWPSVATMTTAAAGAALVAVDLRRNR